jgi:L-iditol 2-dehydrogenase
MKAAIVQKPGSLIVDDVPKPQIGPYDVLCKQLFGATCVGTDLHLIHGQFPWPIAYPTILGHESVGRVIEAGSKVRHFKLGDLITRTGNPADPKGIGSTWGGFAEYAIARDHRAMKKDGRPVNEWFASRINQVVPPEIHPAEATMIITWRETFSFISRMGMKDGKTLLVCGSGANGFAFAAHAKNLGASGVALIGSKSREADGRAAGVDAYYDYSDKSIDQRIRKEFPNGFDAIIDAVGKTGMLDSALQHCAAGGSVAMYGLDDFGKCAINPVHARGTFTYYNGGYDEEEAHEAVIGFIRSGKLRARVWLNPENAYPLEKINAAYESVAKRKEIKAVVKL